MIRADVIVPNTQSKVDMSYCLLMMASALFAINYFFYNTELFVAGKIAIRLTALVLLGVAFLFKIRVIRIDSIELLFVIFSMMMFAIHGIEAGNYLFIVIFGILARSYDMGKLLKDLAIIGVAVVVIDLICIAVGLLSNVNYVSTEGRVRNTFGYLTPNQFSLTVLILPILYLVPCWHKKSVLLIGSVLCLVLMMYTNTRSIIGAVAAFLVFQLFFSILRKRGRMGLAKKITVTILIGSIIGSVLIPFLSGSGLDAVLSYRPSIFQQAFEGMSVLDFFAGVNQGGTIDNFYLYTIRSYGIISLMFIIMLIIRAIVFYSKKDDSGALAFIGSMSLLGIIESSVFRPELIPVLFFWVIVFDVQAKATRFPKTVSAGEKAIM